MRILDEDNDIAIKNVMIILTIEEAAEMRDDLEEMLLKRDFSSHTHINDILYEHQLTVAIYKEEEKDSFNERTKKLVEMDK
jgi:hypothetical protein